LKWGLLDWLRLESVRKRQRHCQSTPTGKAVSVRVSAAHGAGFAGLQSCASITCPHCGSKIGATRRDEITRAVEAHRATGGRVLFGTLTLRHHKGQSFDFLASAVADCWGAVTKGKQWDKDRERISLVGFVRTFETKYSAENGWHVHVHFLLFLPAEGTASGLLARLFGRWSRKAESLGLNAPLLIGQDLHEVTGDDAADKLGAYFAKEALAGEGDAAASMGWEMTGQDTKTKGASLTPRQILERAAQGDDSAADLWAEYELGMEGRRSIAWSRGLRALLLGDEEKSDEEIAAEEVGTDEDTVVSMMGAQWRKVATTRGMRGDLLRVAVDSTADELIEWLRHRNVHAWVGGRDDEPDSTE
jgi:DNA-directed RNA polymerase subunit RPC12/RpoP